MTLLIRKRGIPFLLCMSPNLPEPPAAIREALNKMDLNGPLSKGALTLHQKRYSLRLQAQRDVNGELLNEPANHFGLFKDQAGVEWFALESFRDTCWRIAWAIAQAEPLEHKRDEYAMRFFNALYSQEFVPNSPTWWGAGTEEGMLSACFVIGPQGLHGHDPDSLEGIQAVRNAAEKITHSGGGVGIHIGAFRPKGSPVRGGAHGSAIGPVKVLEQVSQLCHGLTQRGKREAAGMCIMPVNHPDIVEFIRCKTQEGRIHNFNISVGATDEFMDAAERDGWFALHHPKWVASIQHFPEDARPHVKLVPGDEHSVLIRAKWLLDQIAEGAWANGEPGLFFVDKANKEAWHEVGVVIYGTNPCGEQPLPDYGVCNLGHVNLAKCLVRNEQGVAVSVDWDKLRTLTWLGVRFLDNAITVNKYPLPQITAMAEKYRNIGLGILGYHDMLLELGIRYGSPKAIELAGELEMFRLDEAMRASKKLGVEKGVNWKYEDGTDGDMRNLILLTIAPTGSTAQLAGVEGSGIEPVFSPGTWRSDHVHPEGIFIPTKYAANPAFSCAVSKWEKGEYRPEFEVTVKEHVLTQAAFQAWNDSGISKTVNLPESATLEDVKYAYRLAHEHGCKGITVYRDNSRQVQVLNTEQKKPFDPLAALKEKGVKVPEGEWVHVSMFKDNVSGTELMHVSRQPVIEEIPDEAAARCVRVKYKGKNLYVFVTVDYEDKPKGLFVKTPGLFDTELPTIDALCRIASLALRAGVPVDKVVEQLRDSQGTVSQDNHPKVLLAALESYMDGVDMDDVADVVDKPAQPQAVTLTPKLKVAGACPECGGATKKVGGCPTCMNCGWAKC